MKHEDPKYQLAKDKVQRIRTFYYSLFSYLLVLSGLAALNYYLDGFRNPWVLWVALFWGLGLLLKGIQLFGRAPFLGKEWEERKIREYMDKDSFR